MGSALLFLASKAARCSMGDENCEGQIYGFRPLSLLTMIQLVVGLSASLSMPLFGAIVDHSKGRTSSMILNGFLLAMSLLLTQDTWFIVACFYALTAFVFIVHSLAVYAYLPEISKKIFTPKIYCEFFMCPIFFNDILHHGYVRSHQRTWFI